MKSPLLIALSLTALGLLVAVLLVLAQALSPSAPASGPAAEADAPWQVHTPAPGRSRVFGLSLPGSTLGQTRRRWGEELKLAIISTADGTASLEGYVERFETGGVTGRLLLAFDAGGSAAEVQHWRQALPGLPMESGARQHLLSPDAETALAGAGLTGLSFIPLAQLDAQVLAARFGEPAERLSGGERLQHWLYPDRGLAVALDAKGREVLQYVAPAEFETRLAAPLRAASAAR